jgi:hypothetical protein
MITPDDKDWTWVIERTCPECGFDGSAVGPGDVAGLVRRNAADWGSLLDAGALHPGRRRADRWSGLEYACHVRDVFRIYRYRLGLMLDEDNPLFPNWDQDRTAVEENYDAQEPSAVVSDLVAAAEAMASALEPVTGGAWERTGRRSDGASFTVATIARYMVHDPIHHVWDVRSVCLP